MKNINQIKIFLIGDNPNSFIVGSSTYDFQKNITKELIKMGYFVSLYIYIEKVNWFNKNFEKLTFQKKSKNCTIIRGGIFPLFFYLLKNAKIVHFLLTRFYNAPLYFLRCFKIKIISTFHDNYIFPSLPEASYRNLLVYFTKLVSIKFSNVITVFNQNDLGLIKQKYNNRKIILTRTGIIKIKQKKNFNKNIDILFVGGMKRKLKGYNYFHNTMKICNPKVKYVVCGEGSKTFQSNYLGLIEKNRLFKLLRNTKVLILPSYYESFGLIVLEAFSLGVPAIVTKTSGIAYYLKRSNYNYLVDFGDVNSLSIMIDSLLNNPSMWNKTSEKCREIAKMFFWKKIINDYTNIYFEL